MWNSFTETGPKAEKKQDNVKWNKIIKTIKLR